MIADAQNPSCRELDNPEIPISLFKSVFDTGRNGFYQDINQGLSWSEFSSLLRAYSNGKFKTKKAAPLFSPTVFNLVPRGDSGGYRNLLNATTAGMAAIDADGGLLFDDAVARLSEYGIEAVCYSTASNKAGD